MASSRGILNIQSLNELTSENPILRMQNRHDFVWGPWEHRGTWRASAAS